MSRERRRMFRRAGRHPDIVDACVVEPCAVATWSSALAAGRHGRELGLTTLSARASELEQDFAYGLVRQLFEAPLVPASCADAAKGSWNP